MLPETIFGKIFKLRHTGTEYGPIRKASADSVSMLDGSILRTAAEDVCGNFFVLSAGESVSFWDHETDTLTLLSASVNEFAAECEMPIRSDAATARVISRWVRPDFVPTFATTNSDAGADDGSEKEVP